ncbi:MAG: gluconeogenesis factor YvcK family protein, partial [Acidobacteriota bacterium]
MVEETSEGANFVVIGGGTGSFTLLTGLKRYVNNITALVNMADDGGSTGQLRDELGVLPPGDIRQCLVALSDSPKARELFNYR